MHRLLGRRTSLLMCLATWLFLYGSCCAYLMIIGALGAKKSGCQKVGVSGCGPPSGWLQAGSSPAVVRIRAIRAALSSTSRLGAWLLVLVSLAGDSFTPLLQHAFGQRWWTSRRVTITAVGCAAILPLTFRRSLGALAGAVGSWRQLGCCFACSGGACCWGVMCQQHALPEARLPLIGKAVRLPLPHGAAVSSAAVSCILVVVGTIVLRSAQLVAAAGEPFARVKAFNPSWDALGALPLIILGFACHTNVRGGVRSKPGCTCLGLLGSSGGLAGKRCLL